VGAQPFDQGVGVDAFDRLLAGRVDRSDEHHVGVVEGALELVHQRLKPRVAVRLHDGDDPLLRPLTGCGEDCPDLGRVMGVIIDDDRAVRFTDLGEAALDTFEPFETGNYLLIRNAELQCYCDGSQCVLDIVTPGDRHVHRNAPPFAVLVEDDGIEFRSTRHRLHIVGADVGKC